MRHRHSRRQYKEHKYREGDTKFDKKMVQITERGGFKLAVFLMAAMTILGSSVISSALPQINHYFREALTKELASLKNTATRSGVVGEMAVEAVPGGVAGVADAGSAGALASGEVVAKGAADPVGVAGTTSGSGEMAVVKKAEGEAGGSGGVVADEAGSSGGAGDLAEVGGEAKANSSASAAEAAGAKNEPTGEVSTPARSSSASSSGGSSSASSSGGSSSARVAFLSWTLANLDVLVRLVLTVPAIFVVALSPLAGYLMDKYGKLKFIYPAMVLWTASGVAGYFCDDIYLIIVSRGVFGVATAFIMTGASALLGDYYSRGGFNRRENALSLQGFFCAFGGAVFISIAGFVSSYSWRLPFLVYGLGLFILIYTVFFLFEPHKFKFYNKAQPQTPVRYLQFVPIYFIGFFIMVVYYISPTQLPYYIEEHLRLDPKYIGIAMSVSALAYGVFSFSYKFVIRFLDMKRIYVGTLLIVGSSFLLLHFVDNFPATLIALALLGTGGGMLLVNNTSYLFSICPENARGRAYGICASFVFLGQFLSPIISQPIVDKLGLIDSFLIWAILVYLVALAFCFLRPLRG